MTNRSLLTFATIVALLPCAWPASADAAVKDQIYDPSCVSRIEITAPEQSIVNLNADPKGEYQPATMTFDLCGQGTQVYGPSAVTMRLKGSGSFRTLDKKAAFKVKMPTGSRIDGLKSFTLNNMVQDPSMMHEVFAYDVYRAVGLKAVRTGYATVTLNGALYGLYVNIETPDERFLAANFSSTQHFYEAPDWTKGFGTFSSRDVLPGSVANFEIQAGSESSRSDLEALAAISELASDDDWWAAFQQKFSVEKVLRFWAAGRYLGDDDNYDAHVNNYFLHSDSAGVFHFLPWGADRSFRIAPPLDPDTSNGVVFQRCLSNPACRAAYRVQLGVIAEQAVALDLVGKAHQLQTVIAAEVAADPRKEMTVYEQCAAANVTIDHLVNREALWASTFRDPLSGIVSAQSSTRLDCPAPPVVDPPPPPPPATTPAEPQTEPQVPAALPAVSINAGAAFTRTQRVKLSLSWPLGATAAEVSNDAQFLSARKIEKTSEVEWDLIGSGRSSRPRNVYVRFTGPDGPVGSVVSDSIMLDLTVPELTEITVRRLGPVVRRVRSGDERRKNFLLSATANDTVSGVESVQIRTFRGREPQTRSYTPRGRLELVTSARVAYVRAVDRAGNKSVWAPILLTG
ncbi:MAG: CotH kinase family protein [Actinobacteria bacterium]|nr:CotH kinase family protein [Actinomycetota bacterium]